MTENPTPEAAFVLSWLPPYFIKGCKRGYWELMSVAEYDDPGWQADDEWCSDLPRTATFDELADWVAARVDFPFVLAEDTRKVKGCRWFSRWHSEPVFFVEPDPSGKAVA